MAHNRNVQCHSIMYFALFICLIANFINSEDVPYTLLNSPSTKEGTVIVLDGHDRYKRQANSSPSPATSQGGGTSAPPSGPVTTDSPTPSTAAPPPPTTSTAAPVTAAPSTAAPNTAAPSTAAPNTAAPPTAAPGGTSTQPPTTTPQYNEIKDSNTHRYYKSRIISVTDHKPPYWVELYDTEEHKALSGSHRVAVSVNVAFTFPFYGHEVTKITIATGGFLYMSPFLHQWLTATQYIAPLMANFDTRLGNDSDIIYKDFTDSFVIEWRNIFLQDQNHTNPFYFQTVLHKNGTIVFSYKVVPLKVLEIEAGNHPVKVGLSDAFYIDSVVSVLGRNGSEHKYHDDHKGVQRRTIYEYHRVEINSTLITENTVVILEPLTTCNIAKDCETCVTQDDEFNCKWCGKLKRCSDGIDWKRQEWRNSGCENLSHQDVNTCSSETFTSTTSSTVTSTSGTSSPVPCVGHEDVTLCMETTTPANVSTPPPTTKTPSTISPTTQTPTTKRKPSTISPPTTKTHSTISPTTLAPTTTKSQTPSTISPTTQTPTTTTLKPTTQTPTTTTQKPATLAPATTTRAPTTTKAPTTTPTIAESTSIRQSTVTPGCVSGSANCSILNAQNQRRGKGSSNGGAVAAVIVVIILLLALICGIGGWFYYAYSHPQSASGQWLIEHRPSQMKQKVAKMKFWKRSTPSGEKYAVETEA